MYNILLSIRLQIVQRSVSSLVRFESLTYILLCKSVWLVASFLTDIIAFTIELLFSISDSMHRRADR